MHFAPGWGIGGWFIPLALLVIPFLVLSDIFRYAEPGLPRPIAESYRGRPGSGVLWLWVVGFFLGLGLTGYGNNVAETTGAATLNDVRIGLALRSVGPFGVAIGLVALCVFVERTRSRMADSNRVDARSVNTPQAVAITTPAPTFAPPSPALSRPAVAVAVPATFGVATAVQPGREVRYNLAAWSETDTYRTVCAFRAASVRVRFEGQEMIVDGSDEKTVEQILKTINDTARKSLDH